jgi:hypothetical protein
MGIRKWGQGRQKQKYGLRTQEEQGLVLGLDIRMILRGNSVKEEEL